MFIRFHWLLIRAPELKAQALLWLCVVCRPSVINLKHCWLFRNCWTEFNEIWQELKQSSTKFVFLGWSENQERCPGLWLAKTFFTSSLKLLNRIQWNLTGSHYQVCVLGPIGNQDGHPGLWLAETFFTSSLQRLNRIQRNLTGTRSQRFLPISCIWGRWENQRWLPWSLILWVI